MRDLFKTLEQELINRGIVYDDMDNNEYDASAKLEGIYEWGFTVINYCCVINPVIVFYDWSFQSILSLDIDEYTSYNLSNSRLVVTDKCMFTDIVKTYAVDLSKGAPVHVGDIVAIGHHEEDDMRFYALADGRMFFKQDCCSLRLVDADVIDFLDEGFKLLNSDDYQVNVNILNNLILKDME